MEEEQKHEQKQKKEIVSDKIYVLSKFLFILFSTMVSLFALKNADDNRTYFALINSYDPISSASLPNR